MTSPIFNLDYLKNKMVSHGNSSYLKYENTSTSFSELLLIANNISSSISASTILNNEVIAVCFNSKPHQVIATWGVIFSKHPFFPINFQSTKERIRMASSKVRFLLTDDLSLAESFFNRPGLFKTQILKLDPIDFYLVYEEKNSTDLFLAKEAFYLLQTSGSTGVPKIVAHNISSALTFSSWAHQYLNLSQTDKFISISPLFFDMSIFDLFSSALGGIELFIPDQDCFYFSKNFHDNLQNNKITTIYLTPTLLQKLLLIDEIKLESINKIILAGEDFSLYFLNTVKTKFPNAKIYNFYGPTETNVCVHAELTNLNEVVIGSPCPYTTITYGKDNEIFVAGATNAIYYLDQDIASDLVSFNNLNYYKTGDLAVKTVHGLKYTGRKDHQVKISSYRTSLIEIENNFQSCFPDNQLKAIYFENNLYLIFLTNDNTTKKEKMSIIRQKLPSHYCPKNIFILKNQDLNFFSDTFKTNTKKLITHLLQYYLEE